jgi:hypothetical protein
MGGWPKDKDAKKLIKFLVAERGWTYSTDVGNSAHIAGWLSCGLGCRNKIYSTGEGTFKVIKKIGQRCMHGRNL